MSDDAKHECETLLNALLPFAEKMLARDGMFIPAGAAMMTDGKVTMMAANELGDGQPATEAIKTLKAGLV
ncbi:MAG TPA: hypothetical protein PLA85_12370 [Micropepsaceae bacterium]|nr:hypothetical protein [Micropepsaceae bacterium]